MKILRMSVLVLGSLLATTTVTKAESPHHAHHHHHKHCEALSIESLNELEALAQKAEDIARVIEEAVQHHKMIMKEARQVSKGLHKALKEHLAMAVHHSMKTSEEGQEGHKNPQPTEHEKSSPIAQEETSPTPPSQIHG